MEHLSRTELFALVGSRGSDNPHLASCAECRELLSLVSTYPVAGKATLEVTPEIFIARAIAIPTLGPFSKMKRLVAAVAFDSWKESALVSVRGSESGLNRRLVFQCEGLELDLRAEKMNDSWSCVARLSVQPESVDVFQVNGERHRADASGFYLWSGPQPPRKVEVTISGATIMFPIKSWKKRSRS